MSRSDARHKGNQSLFSIGKTSEFCGVSTRTLRFYEENGLITPDRVDEDNRYRYYSYDTMRRIQTIRYLLDQGFNLVTIHKILEKDDIAALKDHFQNQIDETKEQIRYHNKRLASLRAWRELLTEGERVLKNQDRTVHTRMVEKQRYFHFDHRPETDEERTDAYLETRYFTESKKDGHDMIDMGGAFNVYYSNFNDRMEENAEELTLLQTVYPDTQSDENTVTFGGFLAVACYHIGSTSDIDKTYKRMLDWADDHNFTLQGDSLERYVLDIYSVSSVGNYVTEILLPTNEPVNS